MPKKKKFKHDKTEFVFVATMIVAVLVIVLLSYAYIIQFNVGVPVNTTVATNHTPPSPKPLSDYDDQGDIEGVIRIPFNYSISLIDSSQIVLSGEDGNVTLPNDASTITVYKGTPPIVKKATLSDLSVGNTVQLRLLPGKLGWIYIIK